MQLLSVLAEISASEAYPAVPVYDLILTVLSLLISTVLPLFAILFLQIRYKLGASTLLIAVIQYGISVLLMMGGLAAVMLTSVNINDSEAISAAIDWISPIMAGLFLPLAIYLVQRIFGNKKVQKTEELDRRYLGKTSVLAMWGGFTIFGDYSMDHSGSKKWPILLALSTVYAFLNNVFTNFFIEISSLYTALSGGRTGSDGSFMSEADYQDFYAVITGKPFKPALDVIFTFSLILLLMTLVFKLGAAQRFWPVLVLMPVTAGLKLVAELVAHSSLVYFFFVVFIGAMMLYLVPRISRLRIPPKKPKWELDPE